MEDVAGAGAVKGETGAGAADGAIIGPAVEAPVPEPEEEDEGW